jgi:nitroimidazol reductase NimA-like FMN-containing flavoprotein (pyridoxamine 5'-phosphate oxidase superfamily)
MALESWESDRTRVRRKPERAVYDREAVFAIIDEALSCHVGMVRDGQPVVLPNIHARIGETVYLHGSPAAGFARDGRKGMPVCLTFTLIDGLVLTRQARTHSLNYRSAVVFGTAQRVGDDAEKLVALEAITNHVVPGRWAEVQQPDAAGLRETDVLAVEITEASAKRRTGVPETDDTGGANQAWAGVIPLITYQGEPQPSPFV